MKLKKFYKNFTFHNIVAHPLMEILKIMSFERIGNIIHDKTIPDNIGMENIANTEEDHPEVFKSKCGNIKEDEKE